MKNVLMNISYTEKTDGKNKTNSFSSSSIFFVIPLNAKEICTLTSEVEPDVTITLKYIGSAGGIGTLNYKKKTFIRFLCRYLEWIRRSILHCDVIFT